MFGCVSDRESEDTVLMILKEIYSAMGVAPQKPGTDAPPVQQGAPPLHQAPYFPAPGLPPPGHQPLPFKPPSIGPQMTNGSSSIANVPMFTAQSQSSNNAIGGPPLPAAPGATYLDSAHPSTIAAGQSPAVGPPPRSGFVRK